MLQGSMRRLRRLLLVGAAASLSIFTATALAGSGVGGVFNLGKANSVNATSILTGTSSAAQLRVQNTSTSGTGYAIWGSEGGSGAGVYGTTGTGKGVYGKATGSGGDALYGLGTGDGHGLYAEADGFSATAAEINAPGQDGTGVSVTAPGTNGTAISATGNSTSGSGVIGFGGDFGIWGNSNAANGYGTWGSHDATTGTAAGVWGTSRSGDANAYAIEGDIGMGGYTAGSSSAGVFGHNGDTGGTDRFGVEGKGPTAVYGESTLVDGNGIKGVANSGGNAYGVEGVSSSGYAGYFVGNVNILGTLSKTAGSFRIDNPLAPAKSYLQHSFVESPDMLDVYNGNVTTNRKGFATVRMPRWFQALNRTFRYQLTIIGRSFAQAIVWTPIRDNSFVIRTDRPRVRVSWQVTGIRHDPYANAHRIRVIVRKSKADVGRYVYPQGYGKPSRLTIAGKR